MESYNTLLRSQKLDSQYVKVLCYMVLQRVHSFTLSEVILQHRSHVDDLYQKHLHINVYIVTVHGKTNHIALGLDLRQTSRLG